ncbi:MAG: hypothetical protein Q8Q39_00175 [bacterium]|nr:hypothetical protein [bacterium]
MQFLGGMQRSRKWAYLGYGFFFLWAVALAILAETISPFENAWLGIAFSAGTMGLLAIASRAHSWHEAEKEFWLFTECHPPTPSTDEASMNMLRARVTERMDEIFENILIAKDALNRVANGEEYEDFSEAIRTGRIYYEKQRKLVRRFGFTKIRSERKRFESLRKKQSQAA